MEQKHKILELEQLRLAREELDEAIRILESEIGHESFNDSQIPEPLKQTYFAQDEETRQQAQAYQSAFNALRPTFFGYPGNLNEDSPLVRHLRHLEAEMFYSNNAGDPFEKGPWSLDGKAYERKLLSLFMKRFGLDETSSWGYITTGGSESNTWAIRNGFRKFPDGRLYFCESAHYSVLKSVTNGSQALFPYTLIPPTSNTSERIDTQKLFQTIAENYHKTKTPAILLLTWGTTRFGSIDEVRLIADHLKVTGIPHYIHVDAAFYGGIPANQIEAPVISTLADLGADSISISLHKFFGVPAINSVLLCKDKADGLEIDYLGQRDTTVSGSRSFPLFSATQRVKEILERSPEDTYCKNPQYFESRLKTIEYPYLRDGYANIFVIPRPSDSILEHFQLASFKSPDGKEDWAHIIVNPFHTQAEMDKLIETLGEDRKKHPTRFT